MLHVTEQQTLIFLRFSYLVLACFPPFMRNFTGSALIPRQNTSKPHIQKFNEKFGVCFESLTVNLFNGTVSTAVCYTTPN
jgi:hypothetical protein